MLVLVVKITTQIMLTIVLYKLLVLNFQVKYNRQTNDVSFFIYYV